MTEQAVRGAPVNAALSPRAWQNVPAHLSEKVVALTTIPAIEQPAPEVQAGRRDWSSAIGLIEEASHAIRISEERADQLEERNQQILHEAQQEFERLNAHIASVEQKLAEAEEWAKAAEHRASDSESWLAKLHDAVFKAFTPVLSKATASSKASGD